MQLLTNTSGTTSSFYKIGKRGVSLYQGNNEPDDLVGINGDVYFLKDDNPKIYHKRDGVWIEFRNRFIANINDETVTIDARIPLATYLIDSSEHQTEITLDNSLHNPGYQIILKDKSGNCSVNNINIIAGSGSQIDNKSTFSMQTDNMSITLVSDGNDWYII